MLQRTFRYPPVQFRSLRLSVSVPSLQALSQWIDRDSYIYSDSFT